ncbi:MAG: hypothetical protein VCD33_16345, partial [Alphaproteobacteria bacterium]
GDGGPVCDTSFTLYDWYPPLEQPFVFETFDLADGSGRQYTVVVALCGEVSCPFEVQLRDILTIYDTVPLDECALAQQPTMTATDSTHGIGDPLQPDERIRLWYTGYEQYFVSLNARPIDLAPDTRGLLVHMIGSHDHVWRHHYLFVVEDDRLVLAWSSREVGGEDLIAVDGADVNGDGFMEILHFMGTPHGWIEQPSGLVSSSVKAGIYRWNSLSGKMEGLTIAQAGIPIYAAVSGVFDTLEAALETQQDSQLCQWLYYNVPTDRLPELEPGRYIQAKFTWRKALAEAQISACNPTGEAYVATLTDFPISYVRLPPY